MSKRLEQVRDELAFKCVSAEHMELYRGAFDACLAHLTSMAPEFSLTEVHSARESHPRLTDIGYNDVCPCDERGAWRTGWADGARWQFDQLKAVIGAWEEKFLQSVRVGAQYKIDMEKQLAEQSALLKECVLVMGSLAEQVKRTSGKLGYSCAISEMNYGETMAFKQKLTAHLEKGKSLL